MKQRMSRYLILAGPLSFAVFAIGVIIAAQHNPWWSLYRNAFSDLGGSGANNPWIFNYTLIASGLLFTLYSLAALASSKSRLEAFSTGLLFTAGIFLILIGVYPSGTRPHTFVSTWFYVQSYLGMSFMGLSLLLQKKVLEGSVILFLGVSAIPLGVLIHYTVGWPSVAVLELAGALFILAGSLPYTYLVIKRLGSVNIPF